MMNFANLRPEDYLRILWRRKWYGIVVAFLVTAGVAIYAKRLPPVYKSETKILVQAQGIAQGYVKPLESDREEDRVAVISEQIKSRRLLEGVIRDCKLYGYGVSSRFSMEDAIDVMKTNIEVKMGSGGTFTVAFYGKGASLARDVTARLADGIIALWSSSQEAQAVNTDQFIDEQLQQAQRDLLVQEGKLKAFKMRHLGTLPEQSTANLAALNGLHNQLIANESAMQRAQDQQLILESRLQDLKRLNLLSQELTPRAGSQEGSAGGEQLRARSTLLEQLKTKRTQLSDLSSKYTDKFPDVIRLKREVQDLERQLSLYPSQENTEGSSTGEGMGQAARSTTYESDSPEIRAQLAVLKREIATREKEHGDILQQIRVFQDRLNLSPGVEQEYLSITRDYEASKAHYQSLKDKKFNAEVAANLERTKGSEALKVIDEAYLPSYPVKPNRRQIALLGLLAGMGVGLGVMIIVEYFDPTLGDAETAGAELNLPVLVCIPELKGNEIGLNTPGGHASRLVKRA